MPFLVDTDVLIDLSRNNAAAIDFVDSLSGDWALSAMTAPELVVGAKNAREFQLIDHLIATYGALPVTESIGRRAYELLKIHARSHGLRTFDSLIAATALEEGRTLVSRNRKHFMMIKDLPLEVPAY